MKRTDLDFAIDAVGFAGFVFLTATGVLVRYLLPPGSGRHTTIWGLDRHEWGAVHFWIAVAFLAVLVLHLFRHWRWILCVLRGEPLEGSGSRLALGAVGLLAVLAMAVAPLGSPVERARSAPLQRHRLWTPTHDIEPIRGRMTLFEIERSTQVPAAFLVRQLGLPVDAPRDVGVAKLGKRLGFDVDDVRRAVQEYEPED